MRNAMRESAIFVPLIENSESELFMMIILL